LDKMQWIFLMIAVIYVICFFIIYLLCKKKNLPIYFLLLGFIHFVGIAIVLFLPTHVPRRKCPYCAELIAEEAKICRYCNRELG